MYWSSLKNVRVLAPPTFSIERWRQWQPLTFPPIQASDGAPRSVKHERRNVVNRVRDCRVTKIQEWLYGMQIQQGVLLSNLLPVQKDWGECKLQNNVLLAGSNAGSVREICRFP